MEEFSRQKIGYEFLERYTGSKIADFQPYILLANTDSYLNKFAELTGQPIVHGSSMSICHDPQNKISLINFGIGSPLAALIAELLSLIKPQAVLLLGLCGGLREHYKIGDYFNPVAAIRADGTSSTYLPERCPALSSFVVQRHVCQVLEAQQKPYHTGVIHTTNVRFWEFKESFKASLKEERSQAIDMECATLFTVGFTYYLVIGALMLITDLPLQPNGVKTIASSRRVTKQYLTEHLNLGVTTMLELQQTPSDRLHYQF